MGSDFTLQSADGSVVLQDFHGKVVWVYFGCTNCPDAYLMTMANWGGAFNQLKRKSRGRLRGILVSIDPQHDIPATLKECLYCQWRGVPSYR